MKSEKPFIFFLQPPMSIAKEDSWSGGERRPAEDFAKKAMKKESPDYSPPNFGFPDNGRRTASFLPAVDEA